MGDEVRQAIAQQTGQDHDEDRREVTERNGFHYQRSQTRTVHRITEGETTGYHPQHRPVDLFEIVTGDDTEEGEDHERNEGYRIGIDTGEGIEHPEEDGDDEGSDDDIGIFLLFHLTFDLQFYGLLGEGE